MASQQTLTADATEARIQRERLHVSMMEPPDVSPVAKLFAEVAREKLASLTFDDAAGCENALVTLRCFKHACTVLEFTNLQTFVGEIERVLKRHEVAGPLKPEVISTLYEAFDLFALELEALVSSPRTARLPIARWT